MHKGTAYEYKSLKEIIAAGRKIGSGTFGVVYKGKDKAGQEIAVKVLRENLSDLEGKEFEKEFYNLSKLEHPNVVRLLGFCDDQEPVVIEHNGNLVSAIKLHRALCFEYLHNGNLDNYLSDEHQGLDWHKRYMIIKGICMGLKYLHMGLECPIYHCDLKPSNILLDDSMVPKIADFGLSRLVDEQASKKTMSVLGTMGFCPPEYLNEQIISKEYDIFSLGVIIIKIICGPTANSPGEDKTFKFIRQVHKKWRERLRAVPGYTPLDIDYNCKQVKKCIEIALHCTIKDYKKRPNIGSIVDQLAKTEKHINDKTNSTKESHAVTLLPEPLQATFLKEITRDFATALGHNDNGSLYKGILPQGGTVAVKRFGTGLEYDARLFDTEVSDLMAREHENILRPLGVCQEVTQKLIPHSGRDVVVEVTERYICYEYPAEGSLDSHINDTSSIDWDTRFKIIKGTCKGIHFLHEELKYTVAHLYLSPQFIWLDNNWVPKLADFGFSRLFGRQTRMNTRSRVGHVGYMAPEYLYRGEISTRSDIYSLGMIILEITTGVRNERDTSKKHGLEFVERVQEDWTLETIMRKYPLLDDNRLNQVELCITIGLRCVEIDQNKRPSIAEIVYVLNNCKEDSPDEITPTSNVQIKTPSTDGIKIPMSTGHLYVQPRKLLFPFNPKNSSSCPLHLTNRTDHYVAARLVTNNPKRYVTAMLMCGVVPPWRSYTLVVTAKEYTPLLANEELSLECCIIGNKGVNVEYADVHSVGIAIKNIFRKAKGSGADNVQEQTLKVGFDYSTYHQPFQYQIEIISDKKLSQAATCVDVHPVEPWILTSHQEGKIFIWDYQDQKIESSFDFTQRTPVNSVRFIARQECFVAGDSDGTIYVYNYETDEKVTSFEAHKGNITSLVVHPTDPLVMSSSDDHLIKIWDWEKGWKCIRTFEGHTDSVMQVIFNPVDTDSIASASLDQTIKIWSISSSECIKSLSDHLDRPPSVLTYTGHTGQCLVIGSYVDGTTQIWDLETETCVETLEGHTNCISSVYCHPELPILLTGSHDGTVRTWYSDTYCLKDIFGIKLGAISAFGYIESVKRVVVACHQGIAIMEMK